MTARRYGYFYSLNYLDKNIETHRFVLEKMRGLGFVMYGQDHISVYPKSVPNMREKSKKLVDGTQRLLRSVDFAVAYYGEKSRTVFLQTIMALENKTPVLCIVDERAYENFPETLLSYDSDFISIKRYKSLEQLTGILEEYVGELTPAKRRFNLILKTKTLEQLEQLTRRKDTTKAELLRQLIDREYRKYFSEK